MDFDAFEPRALYAICLARGHAGIRPYAQQSIRLFMPSAGLCTPKPGLPISSVMNYFGLVQKEPILGDKGEKSHSAKQ